MMRGKVGYRDLPRKADLKSDGLAQDRPIAACLGVRTRVVAQDVRCRTHLRGRAMDGR